MMDISIKRRMGPVYSKKRWPNLMTPDKVRAIRASTLPSEVLAEQYGTSASNIRMIRSRNSWKHIV